MALIILSDLGIYLEKDRVYTMLIPYQTKLNDLLVHKKEPGSSCQQPLVTIARDPRKYCLNEK